MKFLCDRCNTRYSIGDERVRGKILKIRCKHCSNVITVREGMGISENSIVGPLPDGTRAKKSTIAPEALDERAVSGLLKLPARTDAPATRPLRPSGMSTSPGLTTATPAPVVAPPPAPPPPPPALDEEWYVSIDGVQSGPFSLAEAQAWVAQKPLDADLHCWSEGFDDWLPVDKVSHFRGVRKRPSVPPAPPRARPAPPSAPTPLPASESSPRPMFAASLAALDLPATTAGLPRPAPSGSRVNASPPLGTAVPGEPPLRPAFDLGDLADEPDARTQLQSSPSELGSGPSTAPNAAPPSDFAGDDDLHIGEVSRVVNLADLARGPGRRATTISGTGAATASRATGAQPTLRATGAVPALRATGAQPSFDLPIDPGASLDPSAPPLAAPPPATSHRRGLLVLLGAAATLVIAVVIALTVTSSTDDAATTGRLRPVNDFDTSRPDDPGAHRPVPGQSGSAAVATPHPGPGDLTRPHRPTPAPPAPPHEPEAPPADSLRSDEIEAVARKYQDLTQRCYMRSQRGADAILVGDVKKIAVTLQIEKDGSVTDVQLSDHAADTLGKCLSTAIKGWRFRASGGGRFKFSLNFISS